MQIELSQQTEQRIRTFLQSGAYASADEVVSAGVELLDLQAKIQIGLDDIAAGRVTTYDSDDELRQFFEQVKKQGRERLASTEPME